MRARIRTAAFAVAVVLAASAPVAAQQLVATFDQLSTVLKPGGDIIVATRDGRKVTGRVQALRGAEIVIETTQPETFRAADILTIEKRGRRPVLKGLLIGLGIGGALGIAALASADESTECGPNAPPLCGLGAAINNSIAKGIGVTLIVLGPAVGAGIGAAMPPRTTLVYRAPPTPGRITGHGAHLAVRYAWRF